MKTNFDQAIDNYNKILEENPNDTEVYYKRGLAYYHKEFYDHAITDFTKALKLNPKYVEAYNNRGLAFYKKSLYFEAIKDFNEVIQLNIKFVDAYNNRALTYYKIGEYEKAWEDIYKAQNLGCKVNPELIKSLRIISRKNKQEIKKEISAEILLTKGYKIFFNNCWYLFLCSYILIITFPSLIGYLYKKIYMIPFYFGYLYICAALCYSAQCICNGLPIRIKESYRFALTRFVPFVFANVVYWIIQTLCVFFVALDLGIRQIVRRDENSLKELTYHKIKRYVSYLIFFFCIILCVTFYILSYFTVKRIDFLILKADFILFDFHIMPYYLIPIYLICFLITSQWNTFAIYLVVWERMSCKKAFEYSKILGKSFSFWYLFWKTVIIYYAVGVFLLAPLFIIYFFSQLLYDATTINQILFLFLFPIYLSFIALFSIFFYLLYKGVNKIVIPSTMTINNIKASKDSGSIIIFITKSGNKYHRGDCIYLRESKIPKKLKNIVKKCSPCNRCNPLQL